MSRLPIQLCDRRFVILTLRLFIKVCGFRYIAPLKQCYVTKIEYDRAPKYGATKIKYREDKTIIGTIRLLELSPL